MVLIPASRPARTMEMYADWPVTVLAPGAVVDAHRFNVIFAAAIHATAASKITSTRCAFEHAPSQREPRDSGPPFRPLPGCSVGPRGGQQKTLRSGKLGRVREKRTVDLAVRQDRSHEPGVQYRLASGHSICRLGFRSGMTSLGSCVGRERKCSRGRGDIRSQPAGVKRGAHETAE